jgi:GNAT superfamily N-acetyltransferase
MNKIQVRRAVPADAPALRSLVAGLSAQTAFLRFFAGVGTPTSRFVAALLRRDDTHGAWVCAAGNDLLGHATWGQDGDAAELGVVVADPWQGLGIGRALLVATLGEIAARGLTDVRLHVHADNVGLARRLSRGATTAVLADGVVTITRPAADLLPAPSPAPAAPLPNPHPSPLIMQKWGAWLAPRPA